MNTYTKAIVPSIIVIIALAFLGHYVYVRHEQGMNGGSNGQNSQTTQAPYDGVFISPAGDFSADFPAMPSHITQLETAVSGQTISPYTEDVYTYSPSPSVAYIVSTAHYPAAIDVSVPLTALKAALASSTAAIGAIISSSTIGMMGPYKTLDYVSYSAKADINLRGRFVLASSTMYGAVVLYRGAEPTTTESFVTSFQVK